LPLSALAGRLDLSPDRVARLGLFLGIAVAQYAANALARAAAEGLFLSHAGSAAIPVYLMLVGLTAVPVAGWMSRLIDRMPKVRLYQISLVLAVAVAVGMRALVPLDVRPVWFVVLVGVVLVEMLLNIQFWVLVADYFTTLEQKRLITVLTIALATGGTLGGGLANVLVRSFDVSNLLLMFPLLYVVVVGLLGRLRRTETPLEAPAAEEQKTSLRRSLGTLPKLLAEYPIITLMAVVGFLDVFLGAVGSYLSYDIYARTFTDEHRMTAFLGTLKAVMCVLQVVIITFVTRPLISRLGVGRMNILYPLTSLGSLASLGVRPGLPAAIATNLNFDTVTSSLANPVENLTYNAVPPRFLGRVRAISEGMLQPAGLTVGGLLLVVLQKRWSFHQIVLMALGVSVVHVALGWWRGRKYLDSLATQLRKRAVDLAGVDVVRTRLPSGYADEVARLLESDEPEAPAFGLELAARLGADRFLPVARPVLDRLEGPGRKAGVNFLTAIRRRESRRQVIELLRDGSPSAQALVLEAALRTRRAIARSLLEPLLASGDPRVRGLARACALLSERGVSKQPLLVHDPELGDRGLSAVARGARAARDKRLIPALVESMVRGAEETRATAIDGLAELAPLGPEFESVIELAVMEFESESPRVRSAAYTLLAKQDPLRLAEVAAGLEDSHSQVRRRVARSLARAGDAAIPHIVQRLESSRPEVVEAALDALGELRSQKAADAALGFLANDYRSVERNRTWEAKLPVDAAFRKVRIALDDRNRQAVDNVLRVLAAFGHASILRHARQALHARDVRLRANAVEALASIQHRRFVLPVQHVLEALATPSVDRTGLRTGVKTAPFEAMLGCEDRWIRIAAAEAAQAVGHALPAELANDEDPMLRETILCLQSGETTPMSRLLFLRQVALFKDLSLEDLLALDRALRRADYLPDEVIFEEGSVGDDFYLISEGEVSVRTGRGDESQERARLAAGEFFGEMALFDDEPRSATCVAATAAVLLVLDRSRLYSLIEQLPQLGVAICRTLSQRLRRSEMELRAAHAARTS